MKNKNQETYWLTRLFYIRGLGFIYLVIGLILWQQGPDLIGPEGLTPIKDFVGQVIANDGSVWPTFWKHPSLFFFDSSNLALRGMSLLFLSLSVLMIVGFCNIPMLLTLWVLQLSLVNGAGRFYSFGWETMMLEMTLLACFFIHPWRVRLLSQKNIIPHFMSFVPLLWMAFRLMFGAGLIKLRGDACWLDFTCMDYHYQTQPNPHVLSWYFHNMPWWFHRFEVGMTHFFELIIPFLFLMTRPFRIVAGVATVLFQMTLISTGNLAFLNWQTMVLVLVVFDDRFLSRFVFVKSKAQLLLLKKLKPSRLNKRLVYAFIGLVLILSYKPVLNLISPQQRMNQSYDGLHLINSYGLFGSITKIRHEIIISGTRSVTLPANNQWQEYEFKCKPGSVERTPCWITPYHLRLDWQMWFSAMRPELQEQWLAKLAKKMLENDESLQRLLSNNPFVNGESPQFIKMDLYRYEFTKPGDESGDWWKRQYVKEYIKPISLKSFK